MEDKVIDEAAAFDLEKNLGVNADSKNLNDHIPEEGTDDYEYTEYSKTNKTNE